MGRRASAKKWMAYGILSNTQKVLVHAEIWVVFRQKISEDQKSSPKFDLVFILKLGEDQQKVYTGI